MTKNIRELNEKEIDLISGGVCENMSLAECIDGVVDQVAEEVSDLWDNLGDAMDYFGDLWDDLWD